jgi:hypothetical protein
MLASVNRMAARPAVVRGLELDHARPYAICTTSLPKCDAAAIWA